MVSPWRGDAKYDYFQIGEPNAVFTPSTPTESTNSFPMVPVLIGGGITAALWGELLCTISLSLEVRVLPQVQALVAASVRQELEILAVGVKEEDRLFMRSLSPLSGEVPLSAASTGAGAGAQNTSSGLPPMSPEAAAAIEEILHPQTPQTIAGMTGSSQVEHDIEPTIPVTVLDPNGGPPQFINVPNPAYQQSSPAAPESMSPEAAAAIEEILHPQTPQTIAGMSADPNAPDNRPDHFTNPPHIVLVEMLLTMPCEEWTSRKPKTVQKMRNQKTLLIAANSYHPKQKIRSICRFISFDLILFVF